MAQTCGYVRRICGRVYICVPDIRVWFPSPTLSLLSVLSSFLCLFLSSVILRHLPCAGMRGRRFADLTQPRRW